MDMKFTTWVPPREMAEVGMSPVSLGATRGVLMICLEPRLPRRRTGVPVRSRPGCDVDALGQVMVGTAEQHVVSPLLAVDLAIAERVPKAMSA